MGGWFGRNGDADPLTGDVWKGVHHRWADYLEPLTDKGKEYAEALRAEILRLKLKKDGNWHQYSGEGVPIFSDGTVATFSYRAWGDLLAAVWSEEENKDYAYPDFAYYADQQEERAPTDPRGYRSSDDA